MSLIDSPKYNRTFLLLIWQLLTLIDLFDDLVGLLSTHLLQLINDNIFAEIVGQLNH